MRFVDRLIWGLVVATAAAVVLPAVVSPLAWLVVVLSGCFVVVRLVLWFTRP